MSAPLENEDEAVRRTGDRSPDEQDVLLGVHACDHEIFGGERLAAHAARKALALDDARGVGGGADRARLAPHRRTVRGVPALEAMALDHAGETPPLRGSLHVHVLSLRERRRAERLPERVRGDVRDPELLQVTGWRQVALAELPQHGLREA